MKIRFFKILLVLTAFSSYAQQSNCTQNLANAEKAFANGTLRVIPSLIEDCIKKGNYSKANEIRARKLLTRVYLFTDQESKADKSMVRLLRLNPELKIDPTNDPDEFIFLYNKYRTDPVFRFGGFIGINRSIINVTKQFGTFNENVTEGTNYDGLDFNLTLGLSFDYLVNAAVEISTEFNYSTRNYAITGSNNYLGPYELDLTETQTWIDVPLYIRYNFFPNKSIVPYLYAGGAFNYLLSSEIAGEKPITVSGIQVAEQGGLRRKTNYSGIVGAGLKFRSGINYFKLDARYSLGLLNIVEEGNRFDKQELGLNIGYIDSDFTTNYYLFSVGYQRSVYNPKKLKKYRRKK